jgi:hypothetical protein
VPAFADRGCCVVSPTDRFLVSGLEPLLFLPSSCSVVFTRLSGPRSKLHAADNQLLCIRHVSSWVVEQNPLHCPDHCYAGGGLNKYTLFYIVVGIWSSWKPKSGLEEPDSRTGDTEASSDGYVIHAQAHMYEEPCLQHKQCRCHLLWRTCNIHWSSIL